MYSDKASIFQVLLDKDSTVSLHMRNIQTFATEMYKVANDISPEIMKDVFIIREEIGYDLRQQNISRRPVYNGTERVSFLGPKIREMIPENMNKPESLNSLGKKYKIGNQITALADYVKHIYENLGFERDIFLNATI